MAVSTLLDVVSGLRSDESVKFSRYRYGVWVVVKKGSTPRNRVTQVLTLESSACLELFHIFPASAKRVIAIMRMDQISGSVSSRASRSRKSAGSTRRKRAEKPKTIEPALRVLRRCGWFI